ncbi:ABC transporter permease [Chryseolinea lacunae]|uniref:ABC transporter permease n=1 Tax=Chryseolinea lacunae TaxID=2801331 RepID=A0ABS1KW00_9BACT|nr:ABC transporter permease [Chryseolinea lacunae]MBL0742491.1 ABC transporter permease [Chryseolinea lacunae]
MFRNYITIGLRNLVKNKVYTFINISGLAIGLACFILIALYIRDETGYDTGYANADNIYRINTHVDVNGVSNNYPTAHYPAAFDMVQDYPEAVNATTLYRMFYLSNVLPKVRYGEAQFEESKFFLADSSFFTVFDFDFKYGNAAKAFENTNSVVLTEAMSKKYFGDTNPLGKLLQLQDTVALKVTGVLQPRKGKSHLEFDFLAHAKPLLNQLIGFRVDNAYVGLWYYSYVVLQPGSSPAALEAKLPAFVKKYYPPRYTENNAKLTVQNIKDIHLHSNFSTGDMSVNGNIQYVYTLGSIAVLVLIIACINFMNLSIARFSNRGKEVGVRKVMGAERQNLIFQFLGESILIAMMSGLVSLALVRLAMPLFNRLASVQLDPMAIIAPQNLLAIVVIVLFTGLLAGLYPSLVMAAFHPVKVLKGLHKAANQKMSLRKVLVIAQFTVSLILLIGTLVISQQLSFMRSKDMGFDKDQVMMIPVGGTTMARDFPAFKNKLKQLEAVASVTHVSHNLGQETLPYLPMIVEGKEDEQMLPIMSVGYDFVETFNIDVVSGRFFDQGHNSDSTLAFVINESAARALNWTDPIGRKMSYGVGGSPNSQVIGVVKDFNFDPLRNKVGPLVMYFSPVQGNVAVKVKPGSYQQTIASVEKAWGEQITDKPFSFYFLEEGLAETYAAEENLANVFKYFCGLAIFVASLGLFALASFSAERRMKEIGVRKVLGASEAGLVALLYKEFLVLILISFVIASPLAYYFFDQWLNEFAYRINIGVVPYLIAVVFITFIALITVGYQSISAARRNPVKVLRSE